jgi:predicted 2-oxoglutarate/Fe(II)-dependent dioxygenase YbiX
MQQINNNKYEKKIFPITYFKDKIENNTEIKNIIFPKIKKDYSDLPIPDGWITNKLRTSFLSKESKKQIFFDEDQIYERILGYAYEKCFNNFFDAPYEISIDDIWYNYYVNDEYQEFHNHLGDFCNTTHFSCIHYLSFNSDIHEPAIFKDPNLNLKFHSVNIATSDYSDQHKPEIEEGDFIMFPSYLDHCVYPVKSIGDYPRITIALNLKVLKYGENRNV